MSIQTVLCDLDPAKWTAMFGDQPQCPTGRLIDVIWIQAQLLQCLVLCNCQAQRAELLAIDPEILQQKCLQRSAQQDLLHLINELLQVWIIAYLLLMLILQIEMSLMWTLANRRKSSKKNKHSSVIRTCYTESPVTFFKSTQFRAPISQVGVISRWSITSMPAFSWIPCTRNFYG